VLPGVGDEADVDEGGHERRVVRGDSKVACAGEREAGARGRPVHRGEHGLLQRADGPDVRVVVAAQPLPDVSRRLAELGQILTDAEAAACAADHDGTDLGRARLLQRRAERAVHVGVERRSGRRAG
jgi:hypothetical protein